MTIRAKDIINTILGTLLWILAAGLLMAGVCSYLIGCAPIGGTAEYRRDSTTLTAPAPVTLNVQDADKIGTATGNGPARFSALGSDSLTTLQTGSTPRDLVLQLPDKTRVVLSSGTDITAKGLQFNPKTGAFSLAEFGTSSSEPIRAGNEALDRLTAYWQSRDEAQRRVDIAGIQAAATIPQVLKEALTAYLQTINPIRIPTTAPPSP